MYETILFEKDGCLRVSALGRASEKGRVRYTGATMGYQAGIIIAGGSALIIATYLLDLTGSGLSIAAYIAVMCVLSFVAIYAGAETYQIDIEEEMGDSQLATEARG